MMKTMTVLPAPAIFDRNFMVMAPSPKKGPDVVAPYLFDTVEEAQEFIDGLLHKKRFWWNKED